MGYKDKDKQRAYQRKWVKAKQHARKARAQCVECGKGTFRYRCRKCQARHKAHDKKYNKRAIVVREFKALAEAAGYKVGMKQRSKV